MSTQRHSMHDRTRRVVVTPCEWDMTSPLDHRPQPPSSVGLPRPSDGQTYQRNRERTWDKDTQRAKQIWILCSLRISVVLAIFIFTSLPVAVLLVGAVLSSHSCHHFTLQCDAAVRGEASGDHISFLSHPSFLPLASALAALILSLQFRRFSLALNSAPSGRRIPGKALLLLLSSSLLPALVYSSADITDTTSYSAFANSGSGYGTAGPPILVASSGASNGFLGSAVDTYTILRGSSVKLQPITFTSINAQAGSQTAWEAVRDGAVDAALIPFSPTPAQLQEAPDLLYQVFYSVAFAPIFNLPEVYTNLVLTLPTLAKIYTGQVQYWDDSEILSVNQRWNLPHEPIELVLNGDSQTFIHQFTQVLSTIDPLFAALIQPSALPIWPTASYAKFHVETSIEGPISRVTNSPYSMTISLVAIAKNMGGRTAQLVNAYGSVVEPSALTIASALNEKVVKSTLDASGSVVYEYNFDLAGCSGDYAFPFIVPITLVIPRTFGRTTCRAKSELIKFLRWMLHSDAIRYTLSTQEYAAMTSAEVDLILKGEATLASLICEEASTNSGVAPTVSMGVWETPARTPLFVPSFSGTTPWRIRKPILPSLRWMKEWR